MDILAASLRFWIAYKLNTDPAWEKVCWPHIYGPENGLLTLFEDENRH